jgi:guanosine-3',5'-bis(diphosphate) 3'-pyrophosphohydrolase
MVRFERSARLISALSFAAYKHRNQRRKDVEASPYINHPIALAHVLSVEGNVGDQDVLIAAILHDTLEDTKTTVAELRREFGKKIVGIVMEVTDNKKLHKSIRKRLQIEHAPKLSKPAKLVKLADKICNLRDVVSNPPTKWRLKRRRKYFDWAKSVVDGLRGVHPKLERLFDKVYSRKP